MAVNLATDFTQFTLSGASINNPTSLQFGPDGRLYVAQQDGLLKIFTVQKTATAYQVTATETISLVKSIPNHNDNGNLNSGVTARQVTGLLVTGTAANPVIYVGSSDPRIAQGFDSNLDTNSGILSRLTLNASGQWQKLDLVRGLPRSEENHSINGLQYDAATNQIYAAVGGNTNMGAPSSSFGYLSEYAYSAAILKIDLNAIDAMPVKVDSSSGTAHNYVYDLPTLNDPTRSDSTETVFGGNDGLNMAKITSGSPVQIYAPGFRNPYDLLIAQSGKMYTIDNGSNQSWGGIPVIGSNGVTNQGVEGGDTKSDALQIVTAGYYGGHPNPIRANGSAAGLPESDGNPNDGVPDGALRPSNELPSDFGQVIVAKNAKEANFKHPGGDAPALWTNGQSTNGLAEYTASHVGGQLKGDLLTVGYGGTLYHLDLSSNGNSVQAVNQLSIGGVPLDVIAQGDSQPFAGTIWVAKYGADSITILEPGSGTAPPPSSDDDGDGLSNTIDRFGVDPANGMATVVQPGETLTWSLSAADPNTPGPNNSLFGLGLTGLMADLSTPYTGLYDIENITPGGAAGVMTIDAVGAGTALGSANTQHEAFQFGITPAAATKQFTVISDMDNPFDAIANPANEQSQGIYIGTGDQSNYLAITAHANGGAGGIQVVSENAGAVTKKTYSAAGLVTGAATDDAVSLWLDVNVDTGLVTPNWWYTTNNGAQSVQGKGDAVAVSGPLLSALNGSYTVNSKASGVAVGMISTSAGEGAPFSASWDNFRVIGWPASTSSTGAATMQITAGAAIEASTYNSHSFSLTNSGQKNITSVTFDTRTNALPGIIFDPAGTGGDTVAKNLTIDNAGNTGAVKPAANDYSAFSVPHSGGYDVMKVSFNPNVSGGFNPNETVTFSVDIDPFNIKNSGINGDAGSVSGLELTGTTVTIAFDDGTTQTSKIFGDGSPGGGEMSLSASSPAAPTLTLGGVSSGQVGVSGAAQTVQVAGTPNSTVTVLVMTGGSGNNVQPANAFDANKYTAVEYKQVALNSSGSGSFNITVPSSSPLYLAAAVDGGAAGPGKVSPSLVVAQTSSPPPTSGATAINSGGAAYTDADTGIAYSADTGQYVNSSSKYSTTHAITGTNDASLYNTQRWSSGNLTYNVPVASGDYVVTLKFAEIYNGITGAGQRIFDVTAEGALVLDNLDVYQQVGPYAAYDWTGTVKVTDGNLTLAFLKGAVQNPFVSAILIQPAGSSPPPPTDTTPPTGTGGANDLTTASTTHVATITYSDTGSGVAASTIGINDITVSGPTAVTVSNVSQTAGANGSIVASYTLSSSGGFTSADNGTYNINLVAGSVKDVAGNNIAGGTIDSFTVNIGGNPPPPSGSTAAINSGGAAYTDADTGIAYAADTGQYVNSSYIYSTTHAITGTNDANLYNNQRWRPADMHYNIPVASGDYVVTLKFAEIYSGITGAGQRVFDVKAEGALVLDNLDVYAQVGAYAAYDWTGTVSVTDGFLTLSFLKGAVQNPFVSAILIQPAGSASATTASMSGESLAVAADNGTISGTSGDDLLTGTPEDDMIDGLAGNDVIDGLAGADQLTGGPGNDLFDYNFVSDSGGLTIDTILDFAQGDDKIDLSTIDADTALSGNQAFSFIGTDAFSATAGQLRYENGASESTSILVDVDGDMSADMTINVVGSLQFTATDFVL